MLTQVVLGAIAVMVLMPEDSGAAKCFQCTYIHLMPQNTTTGRYCGDSPFVGDKVSECTGNYCLYEKSTETEGNRFRTVVNRKCVAGCPDRRRRWGNTHVSTCCMWDYCNAAPSWTPTIYVFSTLLAGSLLFSVQ